VEKEENVLRLYSAQLECKQFSSAVTRESEIKHLEKHLKVKLLMLCNRLPGTTTESVTLEIH